MEWAQVSKDWAKVQDKFTAKWSKLSEKDLKAIGGKRDVLVHRLEEHYEMDKKKAQTDADAFVAKLSAEERGMLLSYLAQQ